MNHGDSKFVRFVRELRRRRTFRTAGLYIVGAWLVMQAADVFFPGWGLPDAAINVLLVAAILGFPLALVFGWFFDITMHGIVRTPSADEDGSEVSTALQRSDYAVLSALVVVAAVIIYDATTDIIDTPRVSEPGETSDDVMPAQERLPNGIAVLPFANVSNDPDNESFCDGISEEILHRLSGYQELHVIGRTSSFVFKDSDYTIPRISALLGVRYLLQGSVRREGDQIRILAQLVDETGAQIWSSSYDRILESIFAIQDEISDEVASTVVPQITPRDTEARRPDLLAYEYFLEGRESLHRREGTARESLARAIELDPGFAEAHAELTISRLVSQLGAPDISGAQRAIDAALELSPGLPRALAAQGLLLQQQSEPDWAGSEAILRDVLAREPNMVDALNWLGNALSIQEKWEESGEIRARAFSIDPLHGSISINMADSLQDVGDRDGAESILLRVTELPDPPRMAFTRLRYLYFDGGRLIDMNAIAKRLALLGGRPYFGLGMNYAALGDWESAGYWLERSKRDVPDWAWTPVFPAMLLRWQGRYSDALAQWQRAIVQEPDLLKTWGGLGRALFGEVQALAGAHEEAVASLAPGLRRDVPIVGNADDDLNFYHALAWAYIELGIPQDAQWMLAKAEEEFEALESRGQLHRSEHLFMFAQNAVLMGDMQMALDRLERAIEAGWRAYYLVHRDPRWQALADNPRFQSLMTRVKADVDRQRAEVERIDAEEDFPAILAAARSARQAASR